MEATQTLENPRQDQDEPKCIWNETVTCVIRKQLRIAILPSKIQSNDEIGQVMQGMMSALSRGMPLEFQLLPAYCNLCPNLWMNKETNK